MILKYLILSSIICVSAFISTKIINTPIYENNQILKLHNVVLFKKNGLIDENNLENIFCIDFSPSEDITNKTTIKKMFLGKNINGKIRLLFFNKIKKNDIPKELDNNKNLCNINIMKSYDMNIYNIINNWNKFFNLYNHNCRHFSNYFVSSI
jgi:hypothetical protein